eukprot:GFUD01085877.1.p1 GENE.GFUD01085877.1~~GFUD01085877.1.p1  ORF type:complete len:201 (+),score=58.33 GFUD01085877.1:52-654(+)
MLRHRNVGGGNEVMGEGIFIGDVEEPARSSKLEKSGQSEGGCWKYLSLLMIVATVLSLCLNAFQFMLIDGYLRDIQELNDTHNNRHSEWEADRHSVEECRAEMQKMESHMNNRETEKNNLEQEVTRLTKLQGEQGQDELDNGQEEQLQREQEELQRQQEAQRQEGDQLRQQEEVNQEAEQQRQLQEEQQRQQQEQQHQEG